MAEDFKPSPQWKPNSIGLGKSVVIKLTHATPRWKGTTKFGDAEMWVAEVRNETVFEGRGAETKQVDNFTGEVIFFPSEKLRPQLSAITEGNRIGVDVQITKQAGINEMNGRPYTEYIAREVAVTEAVQTGLPEQSTTPNLNDVEKKFVDFLKMMKDGPLELTEDVVLKVAADEKYKISPERAKELFGMV